MFCNRCGTPLQPDYNLCPKCGTPTARMRVVASDPGRFARHVHTLGILWIVVSALWLVPSFFLLTMGQAIHFFPTGGPFAHLFVPPIMFGLGAGFLLVAGGGICVGWGLMRYEPWARIAAIVLGVIALLHPPFGTLLGIYTLWVLLSNDAALYEQATRLR